VRQARQVAATAPSAYGTCGSRQTRNQQVHKCSSPCSCQLTPGRVNSRETCARRLPAKNAVVQIEGRPTPRSPPTRKASCARNPAGHESVISYYR
jgi:hypothetical protein